MSISVPAKIPVPWATSGLKNTIPAASDPVTGSAGYDQGFTAINMTPRTAGGIPPFGQDFNGIFYAVTEALRYLETGALFPYDGTFSTAVGGYPLGARLQSTDGYVTWLNTVANNTSDPEVFGAGWAPSGSGVTSVTMSNANVTLTALQAGRSIIVITGTLAANLNLVFPTYQRQWLVINSASGAFSVTCKTASGSGVAVPTGSTTSIYGDGSNIASASASISFATTAENQAGTVSNKAVSPLGVREAFNASGSAPVYACRAWVNFKTTPATGTYGRSGTLVTVSITGHGMSTGMTANMTFAAGTGGTATAGSYAVTVIDANTFTVTDTVSGTITGAPAATLNNYIRASGNVSSITDSGTGLCRVNFLTALPDANYVACVSSGQLATTQTSISQASPWSNTTVGGTAYAAGSFGMATNFSGSPLSDMDIVNAAFFR